jgi:hypothetical protein
LGLLAGTGPAVRSRRLPFNIHPLLTYYALLCNLNG